MSAISTLNTYKLGFGYSIERWYAPHMIADVPPFTLALTDPEGFLKDSYGIFTHVFVQTRAEQDGVLRDNDIDDFGESFADPHSEKSDHGQPDGVQRERRRAGVPAQLASRLPTAVAVARWAC